MSKLTPPSWAKDAKLTTRGWERNGELLKSMKVDKSLVEEYNKPPKKKRKRKSKKKVENVNKDEPTMLNEAPVTNKSLVDMTESQIKAIRETFKVKDSTQELTENDD